MTMNLLLSFDLLMLVNNEYNDFIVSDHLGVVSTMATILLSSNLRSWVFSVLFFFFFLSACVLYLICCYFSFRPHDPRPFPVGRDAEYVPQRQVCFVAEAFRFPQL